MATWEQSKKQKRLETLPHKELIRAWTEQALAAAEARKQGAAARTHGKETAPERRALLSALDGVLDLIAGQTLDPGRDAGAPAQDVPQGPASGKAVRYVGQAEFGDVALREHIPDLPYWEEWKELGSRRLAAAVPQLKLAPKLLMDDTSQKDFALGPPESAWAGLVQLATRTGVRNDVLFLVPLWQEDSELRAVRYKRKRVGMQTGKSGLLSPHACAVNDLEKKGVIPPGKWNQIDAAFLRQSERYHQAGCFLGFFAVKGEAGLYLNFTCASLNQYTTGEYGPAPRHPEALTSEQSVAWNNYVNAGDAISRDDAARLKSIEMHRFFIRPGGIEVPRALAERIVRVLHED